MSKWSCTGEPAVRSQASDFAMGVRLNAPVVEDLEAVAVGFITDLDGWWEDFHGRFSVGIDFLASAIGRRAREMSDHADSVKDAYTTCESVLDGLTTASDSLLADAERLSDEQTAALNSYITWAGHTDRALEERDTHEQGTDERERWHASYVSAKGVRDDFSVARQTTVEALDATQAEFVELRAEETAAHQAFAVALGGLDVSVTALEIDATAAEAESVDLLITLLDARLLSLPPGRAGAAFARTVRAARDTLAEQADIDLEEHDRRIEIVQAARELTNLGPDGYDRELNDAVARGDVDEMKRLAELLASGLRGLDPDTAAGFREIVENIGEQIDTFARGYQPFFLLLLDATVPTPEWLVRIVLDGEGSLADFELGESDTYEDLTRLFGLDPADGDIGAQIYALMLEKVLSENPAYVIESLVRDDARNPVAVDIVREYLLQNTSYLDDAIAAGDASLQRYLDLVSNGASQAEMDHLFSTVMTRLIDIGQYDPDPDLTEVGQEMKQFADNLAGILHQFNRAGERGSYDITGILEFLGRQAAGFVPFGDQALLVIDGMDALLGGYQESTLYLDLRAHGAQMTDQSIVAMGAIIAAGGPNSEAFARLVNDQGGIVEAYDSIRLDLSDPLHQYLDEVREEIAGEIDDREG